jgi:Asp-tRNA(Asn)/Glu-tRNA(Gln) amidotransferase A subunit family amidase
LTTLTDLGVGAAADAIRDGETTSSALIEACLARIASTDASLQAWVTVDAEGAAAAARERDDDVSAGRPLGPLHGVPLGIKDIIDVAGLTTTAGAAAFAHTRPARDATLVARLRAAGAVIVGKTSATQFASSDPAPTLNPWSANHTPGGSSSGSAAAVAARQVPGAIGTQTVGSILRPAAYCGVVGLKGTFGQVPLDGVVPLAWSMDHAGPIARTVVDATLLEGVLAGTLVEQVRVDRPRFAVSHELLDAATPMLRAHLETVMTQLTDSGATFEEVALPRPFAEVVAATRLVLEAEAAAYHEAMFAEHAGEYGPGIAGLITNGLARQAIELARVERARALFGDAMAPLLGTVDALLSPVAPGSVPLRGEGTGDFSLCAPWSLIGVPSISIPTGLDATGLPLALQLVGGPGGLGRLLGAAAWTERVIDFQARPPERISPSADALRIAQLSRPRRSGR